MDEVYRCRLRDIIQRWSTVTDQRSLVSRSLSTVTGQRSLVNGHWSTVTGQRSLVSGHWSAVTGQRSLVSGHWSAVTGRRSLVSRSAVLRQPASRSVVSRSAGLRSIHSHYFPPVQLNRGGGVCRTGYHSTPLLLTRTYTTCITYNIGR